MSFLFILTCHFRASNKELLAKRIKLDLPCRRLDLRFNFAQILDYLHPALNNMALEAILSALPNTLPAIYI